MEGDRTSLSRDPQNTYFNPLPPHGGRRVCTGGCPIREAISIHSLRMEGDFRLAGKQGLLLHFNPLPPHGGRLLSIFPSGGTAQFQSTPSAWRETIQYTQQRPRAAISIHSLRMEGDIVFYRIFPSCQHFNPLPPHGGRQCKIKELESEVQFQSTPSAWRETHHRLFPRSATRNFNPLPPQGGRQDVYDTEQHPVDFNPLPPHGGRPIASPPS